MTAKLPEPFTAATALTMFLDIATADPNELIGLKVGSCRHCWSVGHLYHWKLNEYEAAMKEWERNVVKDPTLPMPDATGGLDYWFSKDPNKDCPECEGHGAERVFARDTSKFSKGARALFAGVKRKGNGDLEILTTDRQRALENASKIIAAFKDTVKLDLNAVVANIEADAANPDAAMAAYLAMVKGLHE